MITDHDVFQAMAAIAKPQKQEQALRYNSGKLEWSLVDFKAFEPMVQVLMFGAKKYAPNNWKKGLPLEKTMDSMIRHIVAINNGEMIDPESGLPHIGHIQCNAMFWSHFYQKDLHDKSGVALNTPL